MRKILLMTTILLLMLTGCLYKRDLPEGVTIDDCDVTESTLEAYIDDYSRGTSLSLGDSFRIRGYSPDEKISFYVYVPDYETYYMIVRNVGAKALFKRKQYTCEGDVVETEFEFLELITQ